MIKTELNNLNENLKAYLMDYEQLPCGIAVLKNDQFSTLLQANSAYYEMIGYTKEQLFEQHQNRIANILIDDICDRAIKHPIVSELDNQFDLRIRSADDSIRWIHGFTRYDAQLDAFFLTIADITDKLVATARHLSYDALHVRNEILGHLNIYTHEHIAVTDVLTDEVMYLNPSASKFSGFLQESDWLGKCYCDIAFGSKENTPAWYYELSDDEEFTVDEYYNQFYKLHFRVKRKTIHISKLNRKMRLNIITNITAKKQLESRVSMRNALHNCIETLFTTTATNDMSDAVYYDVIKQLSAYYGADAAFFYKFANGSYQLEKIYRVLDGKVQNNNLPFPLTLHSEQVELLKTVSALTIEESRNATEKFGKLLEQSFEQFHVDYTIDQFSCIAVNDSNGEIIAFMGVANPHANEETKELMELLSRFICMFIEHQRDQKMHQEAIVLENASRANIIAKCTANFQSVAHAKDNIVDALDALSSHYGADFAMIVYGNNNSDTYGVPYVGGQSIPDLSTFQNQPSYTMEKWKETFKKHAQFVTDTELDAPTAKMILKKQFGIYNFIVVPLQGASGELEGLLFINNYKLMNRSHLLAHGVAKYISDYLEKVHSQETSQLAPSSITANKATVQAKISTLLEAEESGTLFVIDIDNFKQLNETLGHHTGDQAIVDLAECLQQMFRETDVVGRIGGDTFVVFSPRLILSDVIENKAKQILAKCRHYYNKDGAVIETSASIGICSVSSKCKTFQPLYENADYALYVAKKSGKNRYHVYSNAEYSTDASTANELRFYPNAVNALKSAIEHNDFVVHYQPLYHVPTRTFTQAEALVRMKRPDGTLVYPNDFIQVAESTGMVVEMTYQILEQVCYDFRQLLTQQPNTTLTSIAINMPYLQFTDPHMEDRFMATLAKYDILPSQIKLEVTERIVATDIALMTSKMNSLIAKGFSFELDDFGTEYSNLKMCVSLPLNTIKLDRSLLLAAMESEADSYFFQYILLAIHESNRNTIMEGIETREQLDWAIECNCEYIQGYYFSKPVDFESFATLLASLSNQPETISAKEKSLDKNSLPIAHSYPMDSTHHLMDLIPLAAMVLDIQSKEMIRFNQIANDYFSLDNNTANRNVNEILSLTPSTDAIHASIRKELLDTGTSVLRHVCVNTNQGLQRYDIHISYADETRRTIYLIFANSSYELQRMEQQNVYYGAMSDTAYSYPFHLDIKAKRMEFFNPGFGVDYHMPMVLENFPEPLFAYNYICEDDIDDYKAMAERMYKGEAPHGSFRFYDTKGELFRYGVNYVVNRDATGHPLEVNGDFILQSDIVLEAEPKPFVGTNTSEKVVLAHQIKAHFFFNTLNTISALCKQDAQKADAAICTFSTYMRSYMYLINESELIAFEQELKLVKSTLEIEKLRFPDNFTYELDLAYTDFDIPALTIQPIVENALLHGLRRTGHHGHLKISSHKTEDGIKVVISNNGVTFDTNVLQKDAKSIGLKNLTQRIQMMVGGTVTIHSETGKGTDATILIPISR